MPVQVHHGTEDRTEDRLIPFAAGRALARRFHGAQFVVNEGAGHALVLERTEGSSERIVALLAECEPRASASSGDTRPRANANA